MGFDLHTHSIYSDGLLTPFQLLEKTKEVGLEGIALTDHDSVKGLPEFLKIGKDQGIIVIPGVELSTEYQGTESHILGYGINYHDPKLLSCLNRVLLSRKVRAERILYLLARQGIKLAWQDIMKDAPGGFIGRFQIYRAMKEKGYIDEDRDKKAFHYYLGPQGVAYVPHHELSSIEAIKLIKEVGGVSVLAHPGRSAQHKMIKFLADNGLEGIEVFYPEHTPAMIKEYQLLAEQLGLLVTGGSDFHGLPEERRLGEAVVERKYIEKLL